MTHDNVTDIVERLRRKTINSAKGDSWSVRLRNPDGPAAADIIEAQQADLATLRKQLENAREALDQIADPIGHAQKIAKDGGMSIDGHMAVRLANDAEYLKGIATRGLRGLS